VNLYWNVSAEEKDIYFTVEAKTTGWIGFGISSGQGKMEGADIVIGWVKDGKAYFKDRHATGHTLPQVDSQQDYELISLKEENGKTIMKIKRKFDTCDSEDNKIEAGTTKVIYAYHPDDPSSEDEIQIHSPQNRGARSVMLLNSFEKVPTLPSDTETFEIRHNRTPVSASRTTYKCRVFEMPKFNEIRHIIKVEPVIQAGHEGMVHHMLLYECRRNFTRQYLNYSGECYGPNMPPAITQCAGLATIAAWGIGGKEFYYPEEAGFPIGKEDSPKVLILEIHYDNPENKKEITDSSGLRFYHTKQLRKYDAGVLTVGAMVLDFMIIPPRQRSWKSTGVCSKECTREGFKDSTLPTGGINVFATLLHTHLAGRKIWIRHLRNGRELPNIVRDEHYDFNFQEFQLLQKKVHVASGDSLENVCIYNTQDRKTATKAGLGTEEEMCVSYVMYYPKVNLTSCRSADPSGFFSWKGRYIKEGDDTTKASFWTDTVNTGLKKAYEDSKQVHVFCTGTGSAPLSGLFRTSKPKPVVTIPNRVESSCGTVLVEESMGNRIAPGYMILLSVLFCLAVAIR